MKKLIGTLSRMYFAKQMEVFRGGIKGLGRAYDIFHETYPDNPFVEGFYEGGIPVINAYKRAFRELSQESQMDSIVDFFWIGYMAQKYQTEQRLHIDVPEFHFEPVKFTFEQTH
jgi:hypothetical protein